MTTTSTMDQNGPHVHYAFHHQDEELNFEETEEEEGHVHHNYHHHHHDMFTLMEDEGEEGPVHPHRNRHRHHLYPKFHNSSSPIPGAPSLGVSIMSLGRPYRCLCSRPVFRLILPTSDVYREWGLMIKDSLQVDSLRLVCEVKELLICL
ncbi:hypothetical protein EV360DRAFT_85498 [Lentinula raphanica]|nr:hypothetical protein EV360DRAFT_85498 [Lentinula raphanica]